MSRVDMLHACEQQVQELFPDLPRPEQKALAALVGGVVLSERAGESEHGERGHARRGPRRE